jgi:hypothetical protein
VPAPLLVFVLLLAADPAASVLLAADPAASVLLAADPAASVPAPSPALAADARARLVYAPEPEVGVCPTADEFRAAVNARAGRELFGEPATVTIDVSLRHDGEGHVALVDLPDADRTKRATRELRSDTSCADVAAAAALVVSLALDPTSILRAPAPPPPVAAPAPPAPRKWLALGAGPRGSWGLAPTFTPGLALSALVRAERASLGLELAGFAPGDAKYVTGTVSVLPVALAAVPCRAWTHWEACGVGSLVALRGAGAGFSNDYAAWKVMAGAGARGVFGQDVGRARVRAFVEGDIFLPRTMFLVGNAAVWTTRGVSFLAGVDLLFFLE